MAYLRACLLRFEGPSREASRETAKSLDEGEPHDGPVPVCLLDLLDALNASDGVDVIRSAVQVVLQELIEVEATALIGAKRHERDGHRPQPLSTTAGDLGLAIPKLRSGSSSPCLLERRRQIDPALFAVVKEAFVSDMSVRKVDDLVKKLGADTESPSPGCHGSARNWTRRSRTGTYPRPHSRTFSSTRPTAMPASVEARVPRRLPGRRRGDRRQRGRTPGGPGLRRR